ncbi:MAG: IS5 family transposase [Actinomycetota bacterium]|nr:IS5 family transposase [Actinomycetota bacterium]
MDLTDEQWAVLEPLIPEPPRRPDQRGRPWRDTREVLDGVLWVLRTGTRWRDLPETYPPCQTCHRGFQRWVLTALAEYLRERGMLDLTECFIDGTFVPAKKGEVRSGRPNAARERSSWRWRTVPVSPLGVSVASASPHEVTLVEQTPESRCVEEKPKRLIGDRAYDSDPLHTELECRSIEMIAPHRRRRRKPKTQNRRKLRRYKRRWKVERLFAWLENFRRLVVRYERRADYLGFVRLGYLP